jgi:beta-lactamase superfamily II metal-dependent hydrolase
MNASVPVPDRISVRMHNVGFGDCFLLSFSYPQALEDGRNERHVLIDFGSTALPETHGMPEVAEAIRARTKGEIDVVVLTHRHRDHLSAFGTKAIASQLAEVRPPKLVVRPWTEDPAADEHFTGGGDGPGERSLAFLRSLRDAHGFADAIAENVTSTSEFGLSAELHQMAVTQLANAGAVAQLDTWAAGAGEYLYYGRPTKTGEIVPGLSVRVLGPPTIDQHPEVAGQRETDHEEFWMLYRRLVDSVPREVFHRLAVRSERTAEDALTPRDATQPTSLGPTRWITDRLDHQQLSSLLRIVRTMDDQLNNTSLILLLSVETADGTNRMLFGGDAQIENWEYALKLADAETNAALLREVDLYKVGHHGSRNATPRTLFNLWNEPATRKRPMVALMSTKVGVHGESPETRVPRETLVSALRERTRGALHNSEDLGGIWTEFSVNTASPQTFTESGRSEVRPPG